MSEKLSTLLVKVKGNKNGPVLINEDDFDESIHKVEKNQEIAAPVEPVEPVEPVQMMTLQKDKRFFVVDNMGQPIEDVEGIDAENGYDSEKDAVAAIAAVQGS